MAAYQSPKLLVGVRVPAGMHFVQLSRKLNYYNVGKINGILMKYYTIVDPKDPENNDFSSEFTTYSEKEILEMYWDYWYEKMCAKYGKEYVDDNYSKDDCINDGLS